MPSLNFSVDDILERYENPKRIGGGGQKIVFVVKDSSGKHVVIKIGGYNSVQTLARAQREVQTLSAINSKYYPHQFGFEIVNGQRYVICEEYIKGKPLIELLDAYSEEPKLINLASHLVCALNELWKKRIVHRDIKPANILITANEPKIIDLGIARLLDATSLTHSFAPVGPCTPNYASPEQLKNKKRDIDPRSDQFSLGIVLAQLALHGVHPFDPQIVGGDSIPDNIINAIWAKDQLIESISPAFVGLITRLLEVEPYKRFRIGDEIIRDISIIQEGKR